MVIYDMLGPAITIMGPASMEHYGTLNDVNLRYKEDFYQAL